MCIRDRRNTLITASFAAKRAPRRAGVSGEPMQVASSCGGVDPFEVPIPELVDRFGNLGYVAEVNTDAHSRQKTVLRPHVV